MMITGEAFVLQLRKWFRHKIYLSNQWNNFKDKYITSHLKKIKYKVRFNDLYMRYIPNIETPLDNRKKNHL